MIIIFTFHALERLKERNISKEEIIEAIKNPDREIRENGKIKAVKKIDNKVVVIIFRRENSKIVIITAFKSSKVHKYLK